MIPSFISSSLTKGLFIGIYLLICMQYVVQAQKSTGINNSSPSTNAALDIKTTTGYNQGLFIPRLAATWTAGLGTTDEGLMFYNTTSDSIFYWTGSNWLSLASNNRNPSITAQNGLTYSSGLVQMGGSFLADVTINTNLGGLSFSGTTGKSIYINNSGSVGTALSMNTSTVFGIQVFNSNSAGSAISGITSSVSGIGVNAQASSTATGLKSVGGTAGIFTNSAGTITSTLSNASYAGTFMGGNVGIGTSSPATTLHVSSTASPAFTLQDGTQGAGKVLTSNAAGGASWQTVGGGSYWTLTGNPGINNTNFIGTINNASLRFRTNNTERIVLDSNGVAQFNLTSILMNDDNYAGTGLIQFAYAGQKQSSIRYNDAYGVLEFRGGASTSGDLVVSQSGKVGIGTFSPSALLHIYNGGSGTGDTNFLLLGGGNARMLVTVSDKSTIYSQGWSGTSGQPLLLTATSDASSGLMLLPSGNVGIGTTNPAYTLDVTGDINITSATNVLRVAGSEVVRVPVTYAPYNIYLGGSGNASSTGYYNAFTGYLAGSSISSGTYNTFNGYYAGYTNSTASYNTFNGASAGRKNTTGTYNTFVGYNAGYSNTTGSYNTFIGHNTNNYWAYVQGNNNTFVGQDADANVAGLTVSSAFGCGAIVTGSNLVRLGSTAVTNVCGPTYSCPSDGRFKYNISEEDVKGLDFVLKLRPVVYNFDTRQLDKFLCSGLPDSMWKSREKCFDYDPSTSIRQSGFIAQEVEKAAQECGYDFNGVRPTSHDKDHYSLAYSQFVVPLVKAVQEQQKAFDSLLLENESLKKRLASLEPLFHKLEALKQQLGIEAKVK